MSPGKKIAAALLVVFIILGLSGALFKIVDALLAVQ